MNTIVEGLLRSSGPDERPTVVPAATQTAYSSDPEQCKLQCKARFLQSLGLREGATYEEACVSLTKDQPRQWFWGLYCCDSTNCGVYIDHDPTLLEQSPTVDLIINQCRNIGYDDIYDPGPPQITCGDSTPFLIPLNIGPPTLTTSDISISVLSLPTSTASSAIPSETPTPTAGVGAAATSLPSNDETASKSGRLSDGAKVAIGVCVTLATASLAIALLFMRRRRRNSRGYQRTAPTPAQHSRTDSEPPPQASHMPLMTPPPSSSSKTTPSTPPPLRLSDRKYLPPPYSPSSNTTTPPATPNADGSTVSEAGAIISPHAAVPFARSPPSFPAATSRFVVPRHERRATKFAMYYGAPRSTSTIIPGTATLRQSMSSNESGVGLPRPNPPMEQPPVAAAAAPMPTKSTSLLSLPPPSYPARPPRPLTSVPPLEIPDLVTPAGPPPTWALPQPPPPASPPYSSTNAAALHLPLKPPPPPPPPHRLHPHAPLPPLMPPAPAAAVSTPLSPILSVSPLSSPGSASSPAGSPLLPSTPPASTATLPPPSSTSYNDIPPRHNDISASRGVALPNQLLRELQHSSKPERKSVKRDTHESWGSWSGGVDEHHPERKRGATTTNNSNSSSGGGGGNFGSGLNGKKGSDGHQSERISSIALKELDLEKLGGSY
ncbi:hypothetical protein PG990_003919 [Apiospora arundinis]